MDENLRQPLRRQSWRDRLRPLAPTPLRLATILTLASAVALVMWLRDRYDPLQHEPVVHLQIEPMPPVTTASTTPVAPDGAPAVPDDGEDGAIDLFADDNAPSGLETTETETAVVVAPRIRLTPAPAKGFVENGADGPLPKIGPDNRRPFDVYARPVHKAILQSARPKIAILLGGMGLNPNLTDRAVKELPEEITLAFAPYGTNLQKAINTARGEGHEVMLQLPMEPFGYPASNPGPHTLLVSAEPKATQASLSWFLSRFSGYTGVVNHLGGRFTSEEEAMVPVIATLKQRGLVYLDDGSSPRSRAGEIAAKLDLPARQADVIIDADTDFNSIAAKLDELEKMSRNGRVAIGVGTGFPATIDAIAAWTKKLESKGVLLVPMSAAFRDRAG
jgi:polysaccharide deacetylase 2 family uncharacterized protein YibQ